MNPFRLLSQLRNALLRRRVLVALIVVVVLTYMFVLDLKFVGKLLARQPSVAPRSPPAEFIWRTPRRLKGIDLPAESCNHTSQGPTMTVDDQGVVCPMRYLQPGGCCPRQHNSSVQHTCISCMPTTHCCSRWEYCVSCCLRPQQKVSVRSMVQRLRAALSPLYLAVHEQFEFCTSKCRTSSQSVRHENTYRDPMFKYCYGLQLPQLVRPLR
eukprot:scpid91074/ scgid1292/ UPF0454 protein C12orf49